MPRASLESAGLKNVMNVSSDKRVGGKLSYNF
jgi:hypothetical protein